jgi:hypothetical protein
MLACSAGEIIVAHRMSRAAEIHCSGEWFLPARFRAPPALRSLPPDLCSLPFCSHSDTAGEAGQPGVPPQRIGRRSGNEPLTAEQPSRLPGRASACQPAHPSPAHEPQTRARPAAHRPRVRGAATGTGARTTAAARAEARAPRGCEPAALPLLAPRIEQQGQLGLGEPASKRSAAGRWRRAGRGRRARRAAAPRPAAARPGSGAAAARTRREDPSQPIHPSHPGQPSAFKFAAAAAAALSTRTRC